MKFLKNLFISICLCFCIIFFGCNQTPVPPSEDIPGQSQPGEGGSGSGDQEGGSENQEGEGEPEGDEPESGKPEEELKELTDAEKTAAFNILKGL